MTYYIAEIDIMPLKELLDPQGKAVNSGLKKLDIQSVEDVRVGKHITLRFNDAANKEEAEEKTELACKKLLANPVIESYQYEVKEVEE